MKSNHFALAFACVFAPVLTGCVGFTVNNKASAPVAAGTPVPLKLTVSTQPAEYSYKGSFDLSRVVDKPRYADQISKARDAGGAFVQALKDSRAFACVESKVISGVLTNDDSSSDLTIEARFKGRYTTDPAARGKAFITGFLFFLPMPFISYKDAVELTGDLSIYDRSGRLIGKYNESHNVDITARIVSESGPDAVAAGMEAVASGLAVKLVNKLVNDRAALEQASKRPAERPKP